MNEYEYRTISILILIVTIITMLYTWAFSVIITGEMFSFTLTGVLGVIGMIGILLANIVRHVRRQYYHELERLLDEAVHLPVVKDVFPSDPVTETRQNGKQPRWSVLQYRNFNDFRWGSFDAYVTEDEVVIRGMLKRGHPSLYLRILGRR